MNKKNGFIHSIIYALLSQGISLCLSIVMSLFLPKILGVVDYSYFQLFLFYTSYSGLALFGLNDGIYLKNGGKAWEDIDKESIGNQWKISFIFQFVLVSLVILFLIIQNIFSFDPNRMFVLFATGIYLLIFNTWGYFGYVFQAVNQTEIYSKSVMLDRGFFILFLISLVFLNNYNYKIYILFYIISKLISAVYLIYLGKDLINYSLVNLKKIFLDMFDNMKVGLNLTIANLASMLILGSGRMFIDAYWGVEIFGKVSFSLSLTNFFLQFISQISIVLFPTLRKYDNNKLIDIYELINGIFLIILPIIYLAYPFVFFILSNWLPAYRESLYYLSILLPICIFDCKMSILNNTYFKVLRLEKEILKINIITMILSICLQFSCVKISNNIFLVLFGMVFSIAFRSTFSSIYISRLFKINYIKNILSEIFIAILFMFLSINFTGIIQFSLLLLTYLLYILFNYTIFKKIHYLRRYLK